MYILFFLIFKNQAYVISVAANRRPCSQLALLKPTAPPALRFTDAHNKTQEGVNSPCRDTTGVLSRVASIATADHCVVLLHVVVGDCGLLTLTRLISQQLFLL